MSYTLLSLTNRILFIFALWSQLPEVFAVDFCPHCNHELQSVAAAEGGQHCSMCDEYFAASTELAQTIREAAAESRFDLPQSSIQPPDRDMLNRLREAQLVAVQLMMNNEAAIPYAAYSEAAQMILLFRSIYPAAEMNYGRFTVGSGAGMALCLREKRWENIDYFLVFRRTLSIFINMQSDNESQLTSEHRNFVETVRQRLQLDDEENKLTPYMQALFEQVTISPEGSPDFHQRLESRLSERGYFLFNIEGYEFDLITVVRSEQDGQSVDYYILTRPNLIVLVQQGQEAPTLSSLHELMNAGNDIVNSNSWLAEFIFNPERLAQLLRLQIQSSELSEPLRSDVQGIVSTPNAPLSADSADTFINHFTQNGIALPLNWQARIKGELTSSGVLTEETINVIVQAVLLCPEVSNSLSNMNSVENMNQMLASLQISPQDDAPSVYPAGVEGEPAQQEITSLSARTMLLLLSALLIRQIEGSSQ